MRSVLKSQSALSISSTVTEGGRAILVGLPPREDAAIIVHCCGSKLFYHYLTGNVI